MWTLQKVKTNLENFSVQLDSNYLDIELKVFKKEENKNFRLVPSLSIGETNFNQIMRRINQPVNAPENSSREEDLSPVQAIALFKDMDEAVKLTHKN